MLFHTASLLTQHVVKWVKSWVLGKNFTNFDTKFADECFDSRQTILLHSISNTKPKVFSTIHSLNNSLITALFSTQ